MDQTHENVEQIEHAHHAAHGGAFDRRVATTMAIIAALMASVTMLGHRAHNDTLRLQTEANIKHTQASDEWGYYQAKNIRRHAYQSSLAMMEVLPRAAGTDDKYKAMRDEWQKQLADYKIELPEQKHKAEGLVAEGETLTRLSEDAHHRGNWF